MLGDVEMVKVSDRDFSSVTVPMIAHSIWGEIPAPISLAQYAAVVEEWATTGNKRFPVDTWRGLPCIGWKVESGLCRRLKWTIEPYDIARFRENSPTKNGYNLLMTNFERSLIDDARSQGLGYASNGRELKDLELLASLQHFGCATRLLDFTSNAFVALWFACDRMHETAEVPGVVIGACSRKGNIFRKITSPEEAGKNLEYFATEGFHIFAWSPMKAYERMHVQHSNFLFGQLYDGIWGSLSPSPFPPYEDEAPFVAIAISNTLKEAAEGFFRNAFGYAANSLFPDLSGFSQFHSAASGAAMKSRYDQLTSKDRSQK